MLAGDFEGQLLFKHAGRCEEIAMRLNRALPNDVRILKSESKNIRQEKLSIRNPLQIHTACRSLTNVLGDTNMSMQRPLCAKLWPSFFVKAAPLHSKWIKPTRDECRVNGWLSALAVYQIYRSVHCEPFNMEGLAWRDLH